MQYILSELLHWSQTVNVFDRSPFGRIVLLMVVPVHYKHQYNCKINSPFFWLRGIDRIGQASAEVEAIC